MRIAVIIPTLDEADYIEGTLDSVRGQPDPKEVVVVDGGSSDETRSIAKRYAQVVQTAPGRARQMNRGATVTHGSVLLFLHGDTLLPPDAFQMIRRAVRVRSATAGTFRLAFDRSAPLLRFYSQFTRFCPPSMCFGDRGLFVTREAFERVGGFPDQPIFEDLDIARALQDEGRFELIDCAVTTSARRFSSQGDFRQQLLNVMLWTQYMAGVDPAELAPHYYEHLNS